MGVLLLPLRVPVPLSRHGAHQLVRLPDNAVAAGARPTRQEPQGGCLLRRIRRVEHVLPASPDVHGASAAASQCLLQGAARSAPLHGPQFRAARPCRDERDAELPELLLASQAGHRRGPRRLQRRGLRPALRSARARRLGPDLPGEPRGLVADPARDRRHPAHPAFAAVSRREPARAGAQVLCQAQASVRQPRSLEWRHVRLGLAARRDVEPQEAVAPGGKPPRAQSQSGACPRGRQRGRHVPDPEKEPAAR